MKNGEEHIDPKSWMLIRVIGYSSFDSTHLFKVSDFCGFEDNFFSFLF